MMAMDGDVLWLAIAKVLMDRSTIPPTPDMIVNIQQFWKDVCNEQVDHIQNNAEVPAGIALQAGSYSGKTIEAGKVE
jgi:hypothetical protein